MSLTAQHHLGNSPSAVIETQLKIRWRERERERESEREREGERERDALMAKKSKN